MCKNCSKGTHRRRKPKKSNNLPRLLERQGNIFGCVITGDETWVCQNDPEMEDCQFPTTKIFHRSKSRVKTMSLTFFDIRGPVLHEIVLTVQSTKFTIWKYWKGFVKSLDGNDPNFSPTTHGSCITIVHLLTRRCL